MDNTISVGVVGMDSAARFERLLAKCDPEETLYLDIHSEGGSVFEGFRIYNMLRDWPGKKVARVNVAAFSIASHIAMACDEIEIAENGFFMIHNPYSTTEGDDEKHKQHGELLAELKESMISAYSQRTGLDQDKIKALMKEETYFGASRAIELGLADRVIETNRAVEPLAKSEQLPPVVFAAMFGQSSGNEEPEKQKGNPMSNSTQKVTATVKAIKAAFPKASSDFIVKCMDEEMNMEEVADDYAKAMEEENEELKAKAEEYTEEIEALKAKIAAMEEEKPEAMEEEGTAPVAKVGSASVDAGQEWHRLVESFVAKGLTRTQAAIKANRQNPELRKRMVAVANGQMI